MIVRSSMRSVVHAGAPDALAAVEITISFSGNAFSVTNARGRLSSPSGSWWTFLQNPRMYAMTSLISSSVSRSPNAGIICESPRDGPPCTITAFQLPFGSGVVPAQSVKSGNISDRAKTVLAMGAPFPSLP